MSKERKSGFGKFLLGAGIGVGLGILFAPKSGKETRQELKEKMDDLVEKAKNIQVEDVKATIEAIKSGAAKIKRKADELVEFAVLKGTPVIEAAAREVKNSTIKTLESITAKLKDEEPKKQDAKPQAKKKSQNK